MQALTKEMKQALLAPFQASEVRIRKGGGSSVFPYVTARVVMSRLDEALPWQWSFELSGPPVFDKFGIMHQDGFITVHGPEFYVLKFTDRGSMPPDPADDRDPTRIKGPAKQAMGAASNCFKRCGVQLGCARYLYELSGVQERTIPEASVRKALLAVGWAGEPAPRHWGAIGGIRIADTEDEEEDEAPTSEGAVYQAVKASAEQLKVIRDWLTHLRFDETKPSFLKWLSENTVNHSGCIEDVLAGDVNDLCNKMRKISIDRERSA